jgi:hypothetical protein
MRELNYVLSSIFMSAILLPLLVFSAALVRAMAILNRSIELVLVPGKFYLLIGLCSMSSVNRS